MGVADRLPQPIIAERVVLSPLRIEDADELVAVLAGPQLYRFIGGAPPTVAELRQRYAVLARGRSPDGDQEWLNWVIRLGTTAIGTTAIGTTQATVTGDGQRADVAWVIGLAHQGHGYGREAAGAMVTALIEAGVPWLTAHVHPDHAASASVARACGLRPTTEFHDGEQRWEWRAPGCERGCSTA
jgi:RimJ/RimL family protein N-acetyltransferase